MKPNAVDRDTCASLDMYIFSNERVKFKYSRIKMFIFFISLKRLSVYLWVRKYKKLLIVKMRSLAYKCTFIYIAVSSGVAAGSCAHGGIPKFCLTCLERKHFHFGLFFRKKKIF